MKSTWWVEKCLHLEETDPLRGQPKSMRLLTERSPTQHMYLYHLVSGLFPNGPETGLTVLAEHPRSNGNFDSTWSIHRLASFSSWSCQHILRYLGVLNANDKTLELLDLDNSNFAQVTHWCKYVQFGGFGSTQEHVDIWVCKRMQDAAGDDTCLYLETWQKQSPIHLDRSQVKLRPRSCRWRQICQGPVGEWFQINCGCPLGPPVLICKVLGKLLRHCRPHLSFR